MEGEAGDTDMAHMIQRDSADGPFYHQEWQGMNPTTPIISGGMNALRIPGFFGNLGHSNLILTAGGAAHSRLFQQPWPFESHIDRRWRKLRSYRWPRGRGNIDAAGRTMLEGRRGPAFICQGES